MMELSQTPTAPTPLLFIRQEALQAQRPFTLVQRPILASEPRLFFGSASVTLVDAPVPSGNATANAALTYFLEVVPRNGPVNGNQTEQFVLSGTFTPSQTSNNVTISTGLDVFSSNATGANLGTIFSLDTNVGVPGYGVPLILEVGHIYGVDMTLNIRIGGDTGSVNAGIDPNWVFSTRTTMRTFDSFSATALRTG
jgi:hypothetical protein